MFQSSRLVGRDELIGVIAAMVILLVVFGSVLAMGLPIMIALFGIGIGLALVELLSHVVATPSFTTQLASMIGIGVGIDYALFIVTRYRQGLHDGLDARGSRRPRDRHRRSRGAVRRLHGRDLDPRPVPHGRHFVHGLAVGTSVTVALVMLASITLLPAVLGFAGRTIDRFSVRRRRVKENDHRASVWFRWSRVVQRRPWTAFLAALAVLIVLAIPFFSMRLGFPDAGSSPTSDTTRRAYDLVAEGFGAGLQRPARSSRPSSRRAATPPPLDEIVTAARDTPASRP